MKIVFVSNFLNHHQIPLCEAFYNLPNVEFTFIATERTPVERIKLGYIYDFLHLPYYLEAIEDVDQLKAEELCFEGDVVIWGSAPQFFIKRRIYAHKLTFTYNERWFKDGFWKHPGDIYRAVKRFLLPTNKNYFQLCASAYTAYDSNRIFAFPKRKFRWGYFPETRKYEDISELISKKERASILWVGRLIEWKHPELVIDIARKLKENGLLFSLNIIGTGELYRQLQSMIDEAGLKDCVHLLGAMSPDKVRWYMEKSGIFLFTSDFREGWGAVLNEAMNSGCAVIVSHAIGSAPYLIKHGESGFVYSNGDQDALYGYVRLLLSDGALSAYLGTNAYYSILKTWNSEVAAARLYAFCRAKLDHSPLPIYLEGPMSHDQGKVNVNGTIKRKEY